MDSFSFVSLIYVSRTSGQKKGPAFEVAAPGHAGFYAGVEGEDILVLGGNQSDSVSISHYAKSDLLGVRRLA